MMMTTTSRSSSKKSLTPKRFSMSSHEIKVGRLLSSDQTRPAVHRRRNLMPAVSHPAAYTEKPAATSRTQQAQVRAIRRWQENPRLALVFGFRFLKNSKVIPVGLLGERLTSHKP